jgi:hypothetical protein
MASETASRLASIVVVAAFVVAACGNATPTPNPSPTPAQPTPSAGISGSPTASPSPSPTPIPTPTPAPTPIEGIPAFKHVYLIIMENKEYGSIVGSKAAPFENGLIARYGLATNLYAETHPSEPNYIALTSGGLQGVTGDGHYDLSALSIFDQIEAAGHTWRVYAQGYPGGCSTVSVAAGVVDGPGFAGQYARKHNPAISYRSISRNPTRCANITHLAGFNAAVADFEMIVPNLINDMHSSSVAAGDAFLKAFVPEITNSPAFADSVLFITWDEGGTSRRGGGHIATIVISPGMTPGSRFAAAATHYSMLRTIEDAWRMPYLGQAATAAPLAFQY